jgi:fatty acid desaturase
MAPMMDLSEFYAGPPRRILLLVGWKVGDTLAEQFTAATIISGALALLTIAIYGCLAATLCGKRSPAARAAKLNQADRANSDLWTVHNKRYDLRSFVTKHPGGIDAISLGQGYNCTELFESYHSLANEKFVRATLSRYFVEDAPAGAPDYDVRFDWETTPFYSALKTRVRAHFQAKRSSLSGHHADHRQWAQLVGFTIASGMALSGQMCGRFMALLVFPFCYWWGPSSCMHDGGHFSLSSKPWVNLFCGHLGGAHMSMFSWYHQHTIGHHVDTNIPGFDPDLYHFSLNADKGLPGFRTSVELRTLPEQVNSLRREHFWRWGLMLRIPFSSAGPSIIWDMLSLAHPQFVQAFLGLVPYRQMWMQGLFMHSLGRSILIWLAIIHPITISLMTTSNWISGAMKAIFFVIAPYAIHGCIFYLFSQVSHVQQECSKIQLDDVSQHLYHHNHPNQKFRQAIPSKAHYTDGLQHDQHEDNPQKSREWATHQVENALDYAVESRFWLHVSVGLNLQVIHHLFPQVAWCHYTELCPIVREVCAEFNIKYNTKASFLEALSSHFRYLKLINDEPNASVWVCPSQGRACLATLDMLDQLDTVSQKRKL